MVKKIRHWIRRYFGFSQREVNAFLSLIIILVLLTAAPILFNAFYAPKVNDSSASDRQLLDSLVAQLEARQPVRTGKRPYEVKALALRPFDPNKLSVEEWQELGLPKYMAQRIINYRQKVSDFTYKAELGKIYGLPDSVFQQLYPYIALPETKPSRFERGQAIANTTPPPNRYEDRSTPRASFILAPFNINTADTTQLKQIRGIGSKLSARIVKYRNGLGGFHAMAQLQEVYGLQPEVVDSLQKYAFVPDVYTPPQLSINTATADELKAHPYISSNVARAIVAYREQHGPYKKVEDVQQVKLINSDLFGRLRPYLSL